MQHPAGPDSTNHECPTRGKKCAKCEKIGHYAKYCRTNNEASSAEEDDWSPNTIHSVNQKVHSTCQTKKNGPEFFIRTALVNNRPINFIIDSGFTGNFNTKITVQQNNTIDANWNRILKRE